MHVVVMRIYCCERGLKSGEVEEGPVQRSSVQFNNTLKLIITCSFLTDFGKTLCLCFV